MRKRLDNPYDPSLEKEKLFSRQGYHRQLIEQCLIESAFVTDSRMCFLDDMLRLLDKGYFLTAAQEEALVSIYESICNEVHKEISSLNEDIF